MAKDTLTIRTVTKRRTVVVDGMKFVMLNPEELTLAGGVRIRTILEDWLSKERLTEVGAQGLSAVMKRTMGDVLPDLPNEVNDKLSDEQRIEILATFMRAPEKPAPIKARQPVRS